MINFREKFDSIKRTSYDQYDIVYSVLVHEELDCILDLILNIDFFNQNNKIAIIFHCNQNIYNQLININKYKWIFINPNWTDKIKNSSDLLNGHLENFNYLNISNIKFNYFCLIASNCMFIKNFNFLNINNLKYDQKPNILDSQYFLEVNPKIKDIFFKNNIKIIKRQHEGAIYKYDEFSLIFNKINELNFFSNFDTFFVAEEIILPSIEFHLLGYLVPRICIMAGLLSANKINKHKNINNIYVYKKVYRKIDHWSRTCLHPYYIT
jgi:hypothetical protein